MQMVIDSRGTCRMVYDEVLDLAALGEISIRRGSHVEPVDGVRWVADLSPVQGPVLGPFARRSDALAAETEWLKVHWLIASAP